jgi:hypothetical protein
METCSWSCRDKYIWSIVHQNWQTEIKVDLVQDISQEWSTLTAWRERCVQSKIKSAGVFIIDYRYESIPWVPLMLSRLQTAYVILFHTDATKYPECCSVMVEHQLIPCCDVIQSSKTRYTNPFSAE